ncbi:amino acid ABC transporter permease [Haloarcula japonica]|uniref:Amino acid ABC transporter permease n=1 Tax=Haloarcula japonica (strain ATCC 49778 / DSM 6131 / JCM 7785 / NBRC 101032 / NCIMB 13157 / TR-1) TaxID=1227453 RepID=M0LAR8_HALJT|nr:amino acid ABC transporter permease [Haloarcula japonica]EMA29509.1 amino acid ABC transporter permease [Haloarcula japonica DSM 6131]
MSTAESTTSPNPGLRDRVGTVFTVRPLTVGLALFWIWVLARWTTDFVLAGVSGVDRGTPFVPAAPFLTTADTVASLATPLGVAGAPLMWVADTLRFAADATAYLPALAHGIWTTVLLTVFSVCLGFMLALPLSVVRVYGGRWARWFALSYTELIRGTPLLAQLFVLYFATSLTQVLRGVPGVGVGFVPAQAFWVAVISFTLNSAAYQSEYLRASLESVDGGQLTAARAIGLSKLEGIRYVVVPQGLRLALPSWTNELVYLIKYSSLASFITVQELYGRTSTIANETYQYTELFVLVAILYLALVVSASALMDRVESHTATAGVGHTRQ